MNVITPRKVAGFGSRLTMTPDFPFTLYFDCFRLSSDIDLLYQNEFAVPLEPQAVRVLRYLACNHHRVVSKTEILKEIWGDVYVTQDALKRDILLIRRALGDKPNDPKFIRTYHTLGYQFVAAVRLEADDCPAAAS